MDEKGLGEGTFGCVIAPALCNTKKGINEEECFPGQVTKIIKNENARTKTLKNSHNIFTITGNEGHKVIPYAKQFKVKNLSNKVKTYCKLAETYVNENTGKTINTGITSNTPVYPIRMKNLGVSIDDLPKSEDVITSLRALPFSTILDQIAKLIHHVRVINDRGLIHGDIRTTNIMVKNDGTLTLIDFDWLLPQDDFFENYNHAFGFYSNPPECILLNNNNFRPDNFRIYLIVDNKGKTSYIEQIDTEDNDAKRKIIHKLNIKFNTYFNKYKIELIDKKTNDRYLIVNEKIGKIKGALKLLTIFKPHIDTHIENIETILDMIRTEYEKKKFKELTFESKKDLFYKIAPTFDSYGLAFTLLEFLNIIYEGSYFADNEAIKDILLKTDKPETDANKLFTLINGVLKPMGEFDLDKRETIYSILPLINDLSASGPSASKGGKRKQNKRRTQRRYKRT